MSNENNKPVNISVQALHRMPYYLQMLKDLREAGETLVTARAIATALKLNEVQVRKDLSAISTTKGRPNTGFPVQNLIENMEDYLGYNNLMDAVLTGAGSLGHALLSYKGFANFGLNIVSAFDVNPALVGTEVDGIKIRALTEMEDVCKRMHVQIGIITVPVEAAQKVCDQMLASGILAIWNFAPVHLDAPDHILVQNENMAASLAMLSRRLKDTRQV